MKHRPILLGLLAVPLALASCKAFTGGGSTAASLDSVNTAVVSKTYERSTGEVWMAIVKTSDALNLRVEEQANDPLGGHFVARRANDEPIVIKTRNLDDKHTEVTVHVGSGDRGLADRVHWNLEQSLGTQQPPAAK